MGESWLLEARVTSAELSFHEDVSTTFASARDAARATTPGTAVRGFKARATRFPTVAQKCDARANHLLKIVRNLTERGKHVLAFENQYCTRTRGLLSFAFREIQSNFSRMNARYC